MTLLLVKLIEKSNVYNCEKHIENPRKWLTRVDGGIQVNYHIIVKKMEEFHNSRRE